MGPKINVKERFTDGEIDLSMSDLEEVPVKEIAQLKKAYSLDLSNNRLSLLPDNFVSLTHLTKLDLSKNELKELPEDFGNLTKLKYLDLYQNELLHLPLSFSKLKDLKWLDLKDNPLVPTVARIAGPCLDSKQCQDCARDVIHFFVKLEQQVKSELKTRNIVRQKQLEINKQKKQEEKKGKKKEKQKQKQGVANVEKNGTTKGKMMKDNKKIVNKQTTPKHKEASSSFIGKLFMTLFLTSIVLFVLTSVKFKLTENVETFSQSLFRRSMEQLPPSWQTYCEEGANIISDIHEKTGNITLNVVSFINENIISREKCDELVEQSSTLFHNVVHKVNEIYSQMITGE